MSDTTQVDIKPGFVGVHNISVQHVLTEIAPEDDFQSWLVQHQTGKYGSLY